MSRTIGRMAMACMLALASGAIAVGVMAQGRGATEWTTSGFDAQRSGSVKADPRISVAAMQKPGAFGAFKYLWKLKLEYEPGAPTALTQAVLLDRLIGFRGFKTIAFVGTASGTVHAVDVDFGTPLWKYHVNYSASPPPVAGTAECPGGLTAAASRPTAIAPLTLGGGGGGGRGGRSGGGVGEPGKGSLTLATAGAQRGGGPAPGAAAAGRGARGAGAVPGSAAAAAGVAPGGLPGGARAGGPGAPAGFAPGGDAAYVVSGDGYLHALNVQNGWDSMTPALFLPANTRASGLVVATDADGGAVAYAATTHGCGSQPDGVWAMDLSGGDKAVTAFQVKGASVAGSEGPSLGRDGTVYVATGKGASPLSNALIALEPKTLKLKGSVVVPGAAFSSSPVVIPGKEAGKDLVVVAAGGKLLLFDTTFLANGPVATSEPFAPADVEAGALTSWADAQDTRWVAVPTPKGIVAMKIVEQAGNLTFSPGWTSRDPGSFLPPIVVNGVLFAAAAGTRATPGTLYAMEAATGKALWNSGRTITSTVKGSLSAGGGNVYVPGADGTLYAFGFEIEK